MKRMKETIFFIFIWICIFTWICILFEFVLEYAHNYRDGFEGWDEP